MKQIIQNLNNGDTSLVEVPAPMVMDGHLLIQTFNSLVSSGTEKMLLDFGKANWINKVRQQPERVKTVLDKIKTDGLMPTINAVVGKLKQPIPLGYSNAGIVIAVGANVRGFTVGDRVVSNGAHAELVNVPQNLVAKIPDTVSFESASFTVVAAIALQGIRLIQPSFGETVVVFGLGLIGQIAVQLLKANGCKVIGIDTDMQRCKQAESFGIIAICANNDIDIAASILGLTHQNGADAVIITASAKDDSIVSDAAKMSRKRGRIVLVGVVDLHLQRNDFYEKELSFQVSCSYGPGRYDFDYEKNGNDYPLGFVRWTAQRNFEAVLQGMATGQLDVSPLISQKIKLEDFASVYQTDALSKNIASLFEYPQKQSFATKVIFSENVAKSSNTNAFAIIGAGNFASKVIVPMLKKNGANIATIVSANGLTAAQVARQNAINEASTNVEDVWSNPNIDTVVVATQHQHHAQLCIQALQSGKNVFVEKPLAINLAELNQVKDAYQQSQQIINVGFNRRFAHLALKAKQLLNNAEQMNMVFTINAGQIPSNHWLNDRLISGGRIIGEVCHFIDLAAFFAQSKVHSVCANSLSTSDEDVTILLRFDNGSAASINYFTNGNKAYDKERIELFVHGKTLILENWKRLTGYGFGAFSSTSATQDKGHAQQFKLLKEQIGKNASALIPFDSLYNTSAAAIAAVQSLREQKWIVV
jgi:predicted dehydrogenase/threonine dehydrogenase-like Zn-dependent dehydrogenase